MPILHIIANVVIVLGCFALGLLAFRRKRAIPWLILLGVGLILIAWDYLVRPNLFVRVLPWQDWVFYRNLYAPGAAALVPPLAALAKTRAQRIRVIILGITLFCVALIPYSYYFAPNAKSTASHVDENDVTIQTSFDSCSAAAGATLLSMLGVVATEEEMIVLALTKKNRGTEPMGLYRALKIKSRERDGLRARLDYLDVSELLEQDTPAVITVGLRGIPDTDEEREMVEKFRWQPFVGHSVVFLGRDPENPDLVRIADPSIGLERWSVRHLEILFQGFAFSLEAKGSREIPATNEL